MPHNFLTQHGLKVRLDLSYFMRMITGENKNYHSNEIVANPIMDNMVSMVQNRYVYPSMIKWYVTLIILCLFPHVKIPIYAAVTIGLTLFGMIWRIILPDILLNLILGFMSLVYELINKLRFLPYLIIIVLGLAKGRYIMIAFFALSAVLYLTALLIDCLIVKNTTKRFGQPFHDTEMCAFTTFYVFLERQEGLDAFIKEYCNYCKQNETI